MIPQHTPVIACSNPSFEPVPLDSDRDARRSLPELAHHCSPLYSALDSIVSGQCHRREMGKA